MLSSREAEELIKLGRKAVLSVFEGRDLEVPEDIKEKFSQKMGVFTTILTYPHKELRGCVGIPYPIYPLWYGVIHSSLSASFKDPRFPPLQKEEFDSVIWELSILTNPEEVPKKFLPQAVEVGKDGLMVEREGIRGLLLPQVPVRYGWSAEEFLEHTCLKAGLSKDCWKDPKVKVYKFRSEVFEEESPWGKVHKAETSCP